MRSKITCSVINDLLPLYADNALSSDSRALVEEHLEDCKFCKAELEGMKKPIVIAKDTDSNKIRGLKQLLSIRQLRIVTSAALILLLTLIGVGIFFGIRIYTLGSSLGTVQALMFTAIDAMAALTVILGWILAFHYYSHVRFSESAEGTKKFRNKAILSFAVMFLIFAVISAGFKLFFYGNQPSSDNIDIKTEFQYSDDSYLNQEWVYHVSTKDGKPITAYSLNTRDNDDVFNLNIYLREIPLKGIFEADNYTGGYSYADEEKGPGDDFTYRVTIIYKDKTEVYDMRKEGLFKKQDNVLYSPDSPDEAQRRVP